MYGKMENKFELKLKLAYDEYLTLPKFERGVKQENVYDKNWCVCTGRSIVAPHPHRYYTLLEFVYWCGKKEELYNRFLIKD